jgi:hypothetical protein
MVGCGPQSKQAARTHTKKNTRPPFKPVDVTNANQANPMPCQTAVATTKIRTRPRVKTRIFRLVSFCPGHNRPGHERPGHERPGHERPLSIRFRFRLTALTTRRKKATAIVSCLNCSSGQGNSQAAKLLSRSAQLSTLHLRSRSRSRSLSI